jgi:hypothetical protein
VISVNHRLPSTCNTMQPLKEVYLPNMNSLDGRFSGWDHQYEPFSRALLFESDCDGLSNPSGNQVPHTRKENWAHSRPQISRVGESLSHISTVDRAPLSVITGLLYFRNPIATDLRKDRNLPSIRYSWANYQFESWNGASGPHLARITGSEHSRSPPQILRRHHFF